MKELKIAVKEMAYFVYASGNLSKDFFYNADMTEGKKAHTYLQNKYGTNDVKEVYLSKRFSFTDYDVFITGFADGILNHEIVEEIKSTSLELEDITIDYHKEHFAQAKLYAYLYALENNNIDMKIRLTYIQLNSYQTKSFDIEETFANLEEFFNTALKKYLEWTIKVDNYRELREASIKELSFPFSVYRPGQYEFMRFIYDTIKANEMLYAIAPTGIGKTMATIFTSLKALSSSYDKIFYLTSKSTLKKIALEALDILNKRGLRIKYLELTSKDKCCFLKKRDCDPLVCPFASNYFDRLKPAVDELYSNNDCFSKDNISEVALKHTICPFELSLEMTYYSTVVIGDYNYAYDPITHLMRYFDESLYRPILLVDEAHNLVSRGKDMYSSQLFISDLILFRRATNKLKPTLRNKINDVIKKFENIKALYPSQKEIANSLMDEGLLKSLKNLFTSAQELFNKNKDFKRRDEALTVFFSIHHLLRIFEYYTDSFRIFYDFEHDSFSIKCLDASKYILDISQNKAIATIFFSATLYPLEYYKTLLTKEIGESVIIKSPFDKNNLNLIIRSDINTRYQFRDNSIERISEAIRTLVNSKKGNYIVFFPSFNYLEKVLDNLGDIKTNVISQKRILTEEERNNIIDEFKIPDKPHLGFFVMGGVFSEGVDFVGDMLNGIIIISVCLPQVNYYQAVQEEFFEERFNKGYDYAYTYPGLSKVIQAVGRLIRKEDDYGTVILIDDRFQTKKYTNLFPSSFSNYKIANSNEKMKVYIEEFNQKMLK